MKLKGLLIALAMGLALVGTELTRVPLKMLRPRVF
jgi:hypothetical protein